MSEWQFKAHFRRHAFGRQSQPAIARIKEALSEIKKVAATDPALAAEGAVSFLQRLPPALERIDSSSGAIGAAVESAIETLVPLIAKAQADEATRRKWLELLLKAIEADRVPYLHTLAYRWGDLCACEELASEFADRHVLFMRSLWRDNQDNHSQQITICLSSLLAAKRYEELMNLLALDLRKIWHYQQFGVQALVRQGKRAEAIRYADSCRSQFSVDTAISRLCEDILIDSGFADEAYARYAMETSVRVSHIATYRAIAEKYPHKRPEDILHDLVATTPGSAGKWFATAEELGLLDLALSLSKMSPCDPRTLTRASREHLEKNPDFAMSIGLVALHWLLKGHGHEITARDALSAYDNTMQAAERLGRVETVKAEIAKQLLPSMGRNDKLAQVLIDKLGLDRANRTS